MTIKEMKARAAERAEIIASIERVAFRRYDTGGSKAALEYLDGICKAWQTRPDVAHVIQGLREGFSANLNGDRN